MYLRHCCPAERTTYVGATVALGVLLLAVGEVFKKSFNRRTGDTAPTTLLTALASGTHAPGGLSQALATASDYGEILEAQAHPNDAQQLAYRVDTWVTRGACGEMMYAALLLLLTIAWSVRGTGVPLAVDAAVAFL